MHLCKRYEQAHGNGFEVDQYWLSVVDSLTESCNTSTTTFSFVELAYFQP